MLLSLLVFTWPVKYLYCNVGDVMLDGLPTRITRVCVHHATQEEDRSLNNPTTSVGHD